MPRIRLAASAQGRAGRTHWVYWRLQRAVTAKAKGTIMAANPRKSVGGWMTIQ